MDDPLTTLKKLLHDSAFSDWLIENKESMGLEAMKDLADAEDVVAEYEMPKKPEAPFYY